jgi:hypothetical protein
LLDTANPAQPAAQMSAGDKYPLQGRTVVVLRTLERETTAEIVTPGQVETLRKESRKIVGPPLH